MDGNDITLRTRLAREDVAGLIEALVESLKEGRVTVQKSDSSLSLDVPRVVDMDVRAGVREEWTQFSIELSWRTNPPEIPDVDIP